MSLEASEPALLGHILFFRTRSQCVSRSDVTVLCGGDRTRPGGMPSLQEAIPQDVKGQSQGTPRSELQDF